MVGKRIVVGEFGRPHGVRGLLRLNAFTADPTAVTAYGPLSDEAGTRHFSLTLKGPDLVAVEGVSDRDAAQRLTGTRLFVARAVAGSGAGAGIGCGVRGGAAVWAL